MGRAAPGQAENAEEGSPFRECEGGIYFTADHRAGDFRRGQYVERFDVTQSGAVSRSPSPFRCGAPSLPTPSRKNRTSAGEIAVSNHYVPATSPGSTHEMGEWHRAGAQRGYEPLEGASPRGGAASGEHPLLPDAPEPSSRRQHPAPMTPNSSIQRLTQAKAPLHEGEQPTRTAHQNRVT